MSGRGLTCLPIRRALPGETGEMGGVPGGGFEPESADLFDSTPNPRNPFSRAASVKTTIDVMRKQQSLSSSAAQEREQVRQQRRALSIYYTRPRTSSSYNAYMTLPPALRVDTGRHVNTRRVDVQHVAQLLAEGRVTVDLPLHMTTESAVKVLLLRDATLSTPTISYIFDSLLQPWKFQHYIRIDIERTYLGPEGGSLLAHKLSAPLSLVHLNLNGARVGGQAVRAILQALAQSGANSLRRLELQDNEITLACDSFAYVGKFPHLRALDVSHNCFTLDTPGQLRILEAGLAPLSQLQSLSVAYNKIQDAGCLKVCALIQQYMPQLATLDLAGCFLTRASLRTFELLLEHTQELSPEALSFKRERLLILMKQNAIWQHACEESPSSSPSGKQGRALEAVNTELRELLLHDNVLNQHQFTEHCSGNYKSALLRSNCNLTFTGQHLGIAFPLGYALSDFGVKAWELD
ncbi:hypothetical protein B484DRAFT_394021 [Ochromonadaceae sp. CCMP2298]|nr:hypothetical protein B484DRAFT_394021 [Ochromonadaceae sp. CCMP2298]